MTDKKNTQDTQGKDDKSSHLEDALDGFRKGLHSLGLFCTEQVLPMAEKATREGLDTLQDLLKKANASMNEAFDKAREEFSAKKKGNAEGENSDEQSSDEKKNAKP